MERLIKSMIFGGGKAQMRSVFLAFDIHKSLRIIHDGHHDIHLPGADKFIPNDTPSQRKASTMDNSIAHQRISSQDTLRMAFCAISQFGLK